MTGRPTEAADPLPRGVTHGTLGPHLTRVNQLEDRMDTPLETVAEAAVYLAKARWLTGEVLDLNGGAHLRRYPDIHGHVVRALG